MRIQSGKEGRQTGNKKRGNDKEESKNNKVNEDRWKEEGRKWKLVTERKEMEGGNDKGNRTEGREERWKTGMMRKETRK